MCYVKPTGVLNVKRHGLNLVVGSANFIILTKHVLHSVITRGNYADLKLQLPFANLGEVLLLQFFCEVQLLI